MRGGVPRGGISRHACSGYDAPMRKPSLSVDTFVTALAVLGAAASAASAGCSKSENAGVAPEPAAAVAGSANAQGGAAPAAPPAQAAPALGGAAAAAPVDPASNAPNTANAADEKAAVQPPGAPQRSGAPSPVAAAAVDGGVKGTGESGGKKNVQMACGAGTCSADMKKGTGN